MADQKDHPNATSAPVQAAGPQPQPQPQRRRGLPGWAWALIAGGAVVFIGVIVILGLAASAILGTVTRVEDTADQPVAPSAPAVTATPSTPVPTESAAAPNSEDEATGNLIALNEHADLGESFPIWRYPILDGWEITVFDQEGINTTENTDLGCTFTSSQNKQPAQDVTATDDLTDSLATFEVLENRALDAHPDAELIGELDTTSFGVVYPGGEGSLEFISSRVDYLDEATNVRYTSEIAGRAMPLAESFMYIEVSCPTALVDAGQSPFEELREGLEVLIER
jgi:hypothetical protein